MRVVKPLNENKKNDFREDFFVFDTETYGLQCTPENLSFGVIYGHNYIKILRTAKEFKNEFKKEIYKGKKIFAHNAEYDLSSVFGNIIEEIDNSAIFNGKFITCNYHDTTFCDSTNIYPASAEKIGNLLGYEKGITPDKFINPDKYTKKEKRINTTDIQYCIRDCEIIYKALLQMFERVGGIRITIASTAMYFFRKKYLSKPLLYNDLNDEFFNSYYGGRTEAFKIGTVKAKVYDINSLYPHIMRSINFPDIKHLKKYENVPINYFKYLLKRKEGLAKITIHHEDKYFGVIPYKTQIKNTKKLVFPIGNFTTYVNFNEIRFALEIGYIKILKVHYVVCSKPMKSPFINYVNDLYNERKNSDNELNKQILKLLLNSLYGKFGMREKYTSTYYHKIPFKYISKLKSKNKFYELKIFSHTRNDCYLVTENEKAKSTFFSVPSIASYITSAARVMLARGLIDNENNNVVYCDTDSIFLEDYENINLPCSNELGDWKLEEKDVVEIRGLKNYTYIDENGKQKDAIKGVSKNSEQLERFKFRTKKYIKTKEAIRRNIKTGEQIIKDKTVTNKYDKRIILKDGNTKPIKF